MAASKFLKFVNGVITSVSSVTTSAGVADEGKIPALDATGKLDATLLPDGVAGGTETIVTLTAVVALAAGQLVYVNSSGQAALSEVSGGTKHHAHGFVNTAIASGASGEVSFSGVVDGLTGLTTGTEYFIDAAGGITATAPSASDTIYQKIGVAISATELLFQPKQHINIA